MQGIIAEDAMARIIKSRDDVREIVSEEKTVYGINTGFGVLANTHISAEDTQTLQHKILAKSQCGCGKSHQPLFIEDHDDHQSAVAGTGLFRHSA